MALIVLFCHIADFGQANPLNTYLSTKPSFISPRPLAAASGLTIPLKITLSEIKLSAFIILVFSKQKGLTLVFRNDPLESLKVSSTFDSIPFVREYLQTEIEAQLRTLLMDEVPAIIHRLSLRLWVPEHRAQDDAKLVRNSQNSAPEEKAIDPFASPPQDPVDLSGHILDAAQIASLSLDSSSETHSLFSQKNLLRLGALTDSHRTLSLFTPSIRDAVFRAWAGPTERGERFGSNPPVTPMMPILSRAHSYTGSTSTAYVFSDGSEGGFPMRPSLSSFGSAATGLSLGSGRHGKSHGGRKRKHRIVNLRKKTPMNEDLESVSGEGSTMSRTTSSAPSEYPLPPRQVQEREGELVTPPRSPEQDRLRKDFGAIDLADTSPQLRDPTRRRPVQAEANDLTPKSSIRLSASKKSPSHTSLSQAPNRPFLEAGLPFRPPHHIGEKSPLQEEAYSSPSPTPRLESQPHDPPNTTPFPYMDPSSSNGILEQALMMKIAGEIARRVHDEKAANSGFWDRSERDETPPPAYGQ